LKKTRYKQFNASSEAGPFFFFFFFFFLFFFFFFFFFFFCGPG
jgi:hypothetical protein